MATAAELSRTIRKARADPLRARLRFRRLTTHLAVTAAIVAAFAAGSSAPGVVAALLPMQSAGGRVSPELLAVPVATRDLPVGHVIGDGDLGTRAVPRSAVLGEVADDPVGRAVSAPIHEGELVTERRLSAGGRFGLADGDVAVGVVPPLAAVPITAGDVVALVAVGVDALGGAAARPLGRARVVAVDERAVTVAVAEELAPLVLEAQATGTVEIALTPWGS